MEGLTAGRIVHFVLDSGRSKGDHRPAIVVRVWENYDPGMVQLQVFTDHLNDGMAPVEWRTSVHFDEDEKKPGTWHWIERA